MDYSQLKQSLGKGPIASSGMYLRELVWIECLKALIENTKDDATDTDRDGVTPNLDVVIAKNVNTACKYAGQFMHQRSFFDTCYTAPLLFNRPDAYQELLADPDYPSYDNYPNAASPGGPTPQPGVYQLDQYGIDTPLFDWKYDEILDRYSATISINIEPFELDYGCGWEYCQTKIYIQHEEENLATSSTVLQPIPHVLQWNALQSYPGAITPYQYTPEMFPYTDPGGEIITKAIALYDQYSSQANLDTGTSGGSGGATVRCPNGSGINTNNGIDWIVNPYNYDKDGYIAIENIINAAPPLYTGPILASSGGFEPSDYFFRRFVHIKIGYRCSNVDGNCTGAEYFSPTYVVNIPPEPA